MVKSIHGRIIILPGSTDLAMNIPTAKGMLSQYIGFQNFPLSRLWFALPGVGIVVPGTNV